jgi:acetylornithine deacetylase/succinyl-diaminopimelate desuccinylase-like protein
MPAIPPVERILSDLIRIRSENPPGGETACARYFQDLFSSFGFRGEVVEVEKGRGSFIASAAEGPRSLLFLNHADVVPAGPGWDFDPFSGEIRDGYVFGRGAMDCKGLGAAEAHAFLTLALSGMLRGKLIFAATADEEAGGGKGVQAIVERYPEKLRADFAVNEGGMEPQTVAGRTVYFFQVGEKGTAWTRLRAKGVSSHGALPHLGDNAVVKMSAALSSLGSYHPRVVLIPEVRSLITTLARLYGIEGRLTLRTADSIIERFPTASFIAYLKAITRITMSPNWVKGGLKVNIVPDACDAEVDIRILPGQDYEFVLGELRRCVGDQVEIEIPAFNPPSFSPTDSPYYRLLEGMLKEVAGAEICLPSLSAGATDSRFLRRVGMPAYGMGIMAADYDPALRQTVHGRNERIDIRSLEVKAQFLRRVGEAYLYG